MGRRVDGARRARVHGPGAALREAPGPVPRGVVAEVWHDAAQLDRCVASLVEDGLVEQVDDLYRLPA